MASYKRATILIIAICLCFFHLSSSLDTIIKGKKEFPEEIHNTTDNIRRVLRGGGGGGGHGAFGGGHGASGGGHSSSGGHGSSGDSGGDSSSSTVAGGAAVAGAAAATAGSHNNGHRKKNSSSICMGSNFLAISLLAVGLSSFAILSKLSW
ncbi:hypothetical protein FCM35_KLT14016 [Carex littledalei]|uniref:Glycine-rich protein n=1 Tax=Carex littledalei TaxID=544730 RepID=A0A833QCP3_9POAL|nr:hypothetical protein FCM35_KLT14016 [Carex littledalei]